MLECWSAKKGSNVENRIIPAFVVNFPSIRHPSNEAGIILFSTFDPFVYYFTRFIPRVYPRNRDF